MPRFRTNKEYQGVLGIVKQTDGCIRFRGDGQIADRFESFLKATSFEMIDMDWPWYYGKFNDPADETRMREAFANNMMKDDDD